MSFLEIYYITIQTAMRNTVGLRWGLSYFIMFKRFYICINETLAEFALVPVILPII